MTEGTRSPETPVEGTEQVEGFRRGLLALRLGGARFGVWVDEVLEVLETPPISRLPLPRSEVAGVTSVRGDLIPVLDLGLRLLGTAARRPGHLVLVRHEDTGAIVGLLVDAVETLVTPLEDEVGEVPRAAEAGLPPELVTGVVDRDRGVVTILNLGRAAAPPEADSSED